MCCKGKYKTNNLYDLNEIATGQIINEIKQTASAWNSPAFPWTYKDVLVLGTLCWTLPLYIKRSGMPTVTTGYGYRIMKFSSHTRRNYDLLEMKFYFISSFSPCEDGKGV